MPVGAMYFVDVPSTRDDEIGRLTVKDLMTSRLVTCTRATLLPQVAWRLEQHGVHGLVVMDKAGYARGVVTQVDVIRARLERAPSEFTGTTAGEIMSDVVTCAPGTLVADVLSLFVHKDVHLLLVVKPGTHHYPLGVLSTSDVVRALARHAASGDALPRPVR